MAEWTLRFKKSGWGQRLYKTNTLFSQAQTPKKTCFDEWDGVGKLNLFINVSLAIRSRGWDRAVFAFLSAADYFSGLAWKLKKLEWNPSGIWFSFRERFCFFATLSAAFCIVSSGHVSFDCNSEKMFLSSFNKKKNQQTSKDQTTQPQNNLFFCLFATEEKISPWLPCCCWLLTNENWWHNYERVCVCVCICFKENLCFSSSAITLTGFPPFLSTRQMLVCQWHRVLGATSAFPEKNHQQV